MKNLSSRETKSVYTSIKLDASNITPQGPQKVHVNRKQFGIEALSIPNLEKFSGGNELPNKRPNKTSNRRRNRKPKQPHDTLHLKLTAVPSIIAFRNCDTSVKLSWDRGWTMIRNWLYLPLWRNTHNRARVPRTWCQIVVLRVNSHGATSA